MGISYFGLFYMEIIMYTLRHLQETWLRILQYGLLILGPIFKVKSLLLLIKLNSTISI